MANPNNNQHVVDLIVEKLVNGDSSQVYGLSAPIKAPMMLKDGSYKNKPLEGNEEFTLSGARLGARDQVIFEFSPMDDRPYKQIELHEGIVFGIFEELEERCVAALGQSGVSFLTARKKLAKEALDTANAVERAQKAAEAGSYQSNSSWGRF